jgi:hypothetical protein
VIIKTFVRGMFIVMGLTMTACETVESTALEKQALSDELKKETAVGVALPSGCPNLTLSLPAGKSSVTVSYQEPTNNLAGAPLTDLAYTTIYLSSPKAQTRAIRVWTNDAHGGAPVTVSDIPVSTQEVGLCVTATNWARKESGPAILAPPPVSADKMKK